MANNIRGITIEIGATTTQLDKALRDVNNKTRNLSSELKQINSQLKFDPHNAILLQQKFDVLTGRVEATREKLKALEDAQEQVEQQFKNGEIDEGQYRAFQREIEMTKSQLATFEKEAEDAKRDVDNLGKETDQTGNEFKQMGNDADASGKKVKSGFNTTAINMSAMTNVVRNIGSAIQSAIQAAINLGKKLAGVVNDYLQRADDINTNAKKYGIDTATLQKWEYASEIVDVSTETMAKSMAKITRSLNQWRKGNKSTVADYEKLGVAVTKANGQFRSQEDIFYDVIDALGKMDDEVEADIMSNQIFGRSFQEIEPLVSATSDEIKRLGDEAEDMGLIMSQEQLDNLNSAKDAIDKLKYQLGVILAPVVEALAPYIEQIATWLADKLASPKVQEILGKIGEALGTIFEAVANTLEELADTGQLEELIDTVINFIPVLADFIANSLPALVEFLQQALGLITGLATPTEEFDQKIKNLKTDSKAFTSETELGVGGLKKAFAQNYGDIGKTIHDMLQDAGIEQKDFFKAADSKGGLVGFVAKWQLGWYDIRTGISDALSTAWTNITTWFTNVGNWFSSLPDKIGAWFSSIPEKVAGVFNSAKNKIFEWFNSIGEWFKDLPNKIWNWIKSIPEKIAKAFSGKATVSANGQIGYHGSYAEGGIFKKSSFVNVGEDGPEVVLPLDKLSQVLNTVGIRSGGNIVVNAPVQVVKELNDAELNRVGSRLTDIVGRQFAIRTGGTL